MNNEELKSNLLSSRHWLRLVFMLLFAAILQVAGIILWALVLLQFLFSLFTGQDNTNLRQFGHSLSTFIFQVLKFLTYASEEKPFPFSDWPKVNEAIVVEDTLVEKPGTRAVKVKTVVKKEGADNDSNPAL